MRKLKTNPREGCGNPCRREGMYLEMRTLTKTIERMPKKRSDSIVLLPARVLLTEEIG